MSSLLPYICLFAILAVVWFVLKNKPTKLASINELDERIGKGTAVVLRFYKNT